jgi:ribose 5-phosphate isomerase B
MSRAHNDANVLCLGARVVDASVMDEIVDGFLRTDFEAGRHARRVEKMMEAEKRS